MALEDILESLEEGARAQRADIKKRAEAEAAELAKEAESDAAKIRRSVAQEAAERLRSQEAKILLEARFQAKKLIAEAKEKMIEGVFAEAERLITALPGHVSYPQVFRFLAAEALGAAAANGAGAVLKVNARDLPLAKEQARSLGINGSVKVESDPDIAAGLAVVVDGGRRVGVNTPAARLAKARQALRSKVGAILFDVDN